MSAVVGSSKFPFVFADSRNPARGCLDRLAIACCHNTDIRSAPTSLLPTQISHGRIFGALVFFAFRVPSSRASQKRFSITCEAAAATLK